jgi:hypothetical protein
MCERMGAHEDADSRRSADVAKFRGKVPHPLKSRRFIAPQRGGHQQERADLRAMRSKRKSPEPRFASSIG